MTKSHQGPWEIVRPRGSDRSRSTNLKRAKVQHIELLPPQTLPERSLLAPVPTRTRPPADDKDDSDDRARVECMLCWKTLDQEDADLNI